MSFRKVEASELYESTDGMVWHHVTTLRRRSGATREVAVGGQMSWWRKLLRVG